MTDPHFKWARYRDRKQAESMDSHAHTPGPWLMAAKPSSIVGWPVVGPQGRAIATLHYVQHSMIDPKVPEDDAFNRESRANGRLIAAAPDMYEALRFVRQTGLLAFAAVVRKNDDGLERSKEVLDVIDAALAKAAPTP